MLINSFTAWRRWSIIKRLLALLVLIFVALAPVLCVKFLSPANSPASTTSLELSSAPSSSLGEAQDVVAKSVSAMAHVNSYELDTDVQNIYKVIDEPNRITTVTEWSGTRSIDISRKEVKMDMTIGVVNYYGSNDTSSIEMYFTGGYEYCKATSLHVYGGLGNPWDKTRLTDEIWMAGSQISYYVELLKTGSQADMLGSENITGIDCYILTLSPSTQAIIDWVASQDQPVGPQVDIMFGGAIPVVRADAYQGGSVKLWVEKDNYLPLKAEINAVFDGFVGGGSHPTTVNPYTPTTGHVNSSFDGHMTFSGYNQPVSIQLPQEALNLNDQGHTPWVSIAISVGAVVVLVVGVVVIRHRMTRARA